MCVCACACVIDGAIFGLDNPDVIHRFLLMLGIPDSPQTCDASNLGDKFVTIACITGYDGGDVITYYVETRRAGGDASPADHVTETVNATLVRIRITDLYPGTEYSSLVYAENVYGRSKKAAEVNFRTTGSEYRECVC